MTKAILRKYADARVPRYTSYPTAPHFHPGINAETHRAWLESLPTADPVSIYLHVPFCRELCWYCGCHTTATRSSRPVDAFCDVLQREIDLVSTLVPRRLPVTAIHWGGGTPTLIGSGWFRVMMAGLQADFAVADDAEIAIETDPRTLTRDMIDAMANCGVNRASIGVQTFDPTVQQAINRVQSWKVTYDAVHGLRRAGIRAINIDLLYGLPLQTVTSSIETVDRILELEPDRVSVFGYAHVPSMKRHQQLIDADALPNSTGRIAQCRAMEERLIEAGYVAIGFDHFARRSDSLAQRASDGTLRRNFQGYTTDQASTILGFGPSAISTLPGGYIQNTINASAYRTAVTGGELPTARGIALTEDDRLRRDVIEQLLCQFEVDLAAVARTHSRPIPEPGPLIEALEKDGVVRRDRSRITVPDPYYPLARMVASTFDTYLETAHRKHSAAL